MSERETALKALTEYIEWHGPLHEDDCPCDDTCDCDFRNVNAGVNLAVRLLSAGADPVPVCQWREIATAPKDGTPVLLYKRGHGAVQGWWSSGDAFLMPHWSTMSNLFDPTHWMPLPAPPVALVPAEGDR